MWTITKNTFILRLLTSHYKCDLQKTEKCKIVEKINAWMLVPHGTSYELLYLRIYVFRLSTNTIMYNYLNLEQL